MPYHFSHPHACKVIASPPRLAIHALIKCCSWKLQVVFIHADASHSSHVVIGSSACNLCIRSLTVCVHVGDHADGHALEQQPGADCAEGLQHAAAASGQPPPPAPCDTRRVSFEPPVLPMYPVGPHLSALPARAFRLLSLLGRLPPLPQGM